MKLLLSIFILLFFTSCNGQKNKTAEITKSKVYNDADIVTSSLTDKNGDLWFGTSTEGLYKYDGEKFSNFNKKDGLCANNVAVVFQSTDGKLWLGSDWGALCYFENEKFNSFDKLSGIAIRTIIEDKKGNLWFGGRKGNLWKYDGEQLIDLTQLKNE